MTKHRPVKAATTRIRSDGRRRRGVHGVPLRSPGPPEVPGPLVPSARPVPLPDWPCLLQSSSRERRGNTARNMATRRRAWGDRGQRRPRRRGRCRGCRNGAGTPGRAPRSAPACGKSSKPNGRTARIDL
jgi:hypothetical protein